MSVFGVPPALLDRRGPPERLVQASQALRGLSGFRVLPERQVRQGLPELRACPDLRVLVALAVLSV